VICLGILVMICHLEAAPPPAVVCPPVRPWPRMFQQRVAAELRAAPPDSALAAVAIQAIGDRDVARACAGRAAGEVTKK
jgi:hypothetical protein